MSDILERAKALQNSAFGTHKQALDIIGELIAEVEAKNDKIAQDAITIQMHHENVLTLQKEVERLRSENDRAERAHESLDYMRRHEITSLNARIKVLEAAFLEAQYYMKFTEEEAREKLERIRNGKE